VHARFFVKPLPGGYILGEKVYYMGSSYTFDHGDRLVHGEQGEVIGPGRGDEAFGRRCGAAGRVGVFCRYTVA